MREEFGLPTSYWNDAVPWEAYPFARSDSAGHFELTANEWFGDAGLRVAGAVHFNDRTSVATSHPGFRLHAEAVAGTGRDVDLGDIVLEPGAVVTGRVVDENGTPMAAAVFTPTATGRAPSSSKPPTLASSPGSTTSSSSPRGRTTWAAWS